MNRLPIELIALTLLAAGCASNAEEPAAEDPAAHACEQVDASGPSLTASPSRDTAPVLTMSEQPYTVTLPSGAAGYLRIDGPIDGLLFTKISNVVTGLFRGTDTTDTLPAGTPNEDCPSAIPEHFDLALAEAIIQGRK